jgi:hypothetical protein
LQNGNPSQSLEPPASTTEINSYRDQIGYRTFLQFMLDWGIDDVSNSIYYTQLSVGSSNCSYHNETIDGVSFSMPASEQPMHSIRRALISTTNLIKSRNQSVGDSNQQDRVGLLKIEYVVPPKTILDVALTTNYDSFRNICRTIQSVADSTTSTSLDLHIKLAREQLTSSAQSRANARKIIVVVSDGIVTRPTSSTADIDTYQLQYPWPQYAWFHGVPPPLGVTDPRYEPNSLKRYARNSALMEAHMGSVRGVELYVVKVGYTSHKMMADALAEFGGTTNTANEAPIVTNNPSLYESRIKAVLADIIDNPRGRLVE